MLEAFCNSHFAIFTEYFDVFDCLGVISVLVRFCLKVWVVLFFLCYLFVCKWIDGVLFVLIVKFHQVIDSCMLSEDPLAAVLI